jgi:hypothetical protein
MAAPSIDQLFGGLPAEKRVERFEAYKSALSAVHTRTLEKSARGEISFDPKRGVIEKASVADRISEFSSEISKSISGDALAAVNSALANVSDIQKNITLTSPLNNSTSGVTGLVPYNLESVLGLLVPKELTLRNSVARETAVGQAVEFRRINGVSNSGTGSVSNLSTFFTSNSASTSFNGITLNRPTQITYAADKIVASFVEQGISDSVSLQAEFAGKGYTDLRQLSHTAALWSHLLGEERNMLNGCVTPLLSAAQITSFGSGTVASADTTATGFPSSFNTQTVACSITFTSALGETAAISAGNVTGVTGQGAKVAFTATVPAGAVALNVYAVYNSVVYKATSLSLASGQTGLAFALVTGTAAPAADASYASNGYDGFISTFGLSGGYTKQYNATVAGLSEPAGFFQDAFVSMFNTNMADPDVIYTSAAVRRNIAASMQKNASNSAYRLTYETGSDGVTLGSLVNAIQSEATGKMVDLVTHRFMPAGTAVIHSKNLPFPDSGVSQTVSAVNVVDTMVIDWPQIGFSYDLSTYTYGTVLFRAPAWSGLITGLLA